MSGEAWKIQKSRKTYNREILHTRNTHLNDIIYTEKRFSNSYKNLLTVKCFDDIIKHLLITK